MCFYVEGEKKKKRIVCTTFRAHGKKINMFILDEGEKKTPAKKSYEEKKCERKIPFFCTNTSRG